MSMQYISGEKWFENVNLLGPLTLLGKIESKSLDLQNPVNMIDKNLELYGDFFLTGNSTIRKLYAKDLTIGNTSISTVQQHGLKLDENVISNNIVFKKSFLSSQLTCPEINSVNTSTWISCCSTNHQIVSATKQFDDNLEIDGFCDVLGSINKFNIKELDENILKISGDQILEGKIYFEDIYTEKAVSNKTTIDNVSLEQFITKSGDQELLGDVVIENVVSVYKHLSAEVVHQENSEGIVGYLEKIFYDTALNNGKRYNITGEKYFNNLNIENLYVNGLLGGLDFDAIKNNMQQSNTDIHFKEFISFPNNVTINKLDFVGSLDSISHEDFGTSWLLLETDQIIYSSIEFLNLKCHEPLEVYTGIVNTRNFSTLLEDIVWTDREETLGNITFVDGLISVAPVSAGTISGTRFSEEIVQNKQVDMQYILDNVHVAGNLNVHGQLTVQTNIGNIALEQLNNYIISKPNENPPNIIIKGSVTFEVEPIINFLNTYNITEILAVAWLANEDTRLTGSIQFSNLNLDKEVTVNGPINGVDLKWISENYFSLTRDQNISSSLQFVGSVKFNKKIEAEGAEVDGFIAGINLQEFVSNRLNDESDQVISGDFWFKEILVSGDLNSGTVNSYNFSTSFLRYDVAENYVIGDKIFDELSVKNISMNAMQNIQNVNIEQWCKHSVLENGDYFARGVKTIQNPSLLSDLRFAGPIDGIAISLDTVLLRYGDQTITGKKTFNRLLTSEEEFAAFFTTLYVHGQLNTVHVNELMNNIVFKDDQIVLQTAINFTEILVVENRAEINGLLYGVNVSELINGVENAENFNKYEFEYQELYKSGQIIAESLKSPAYYLSHYEVMQNIEGSVVLCPFSIESNVGSDEIKVLARMDRNNHLSFMTWNNISEEFIQNPDGKERMAHSDIDNISHIKSLSIQGKNHLYVETFLEPQKARMKSSEHLNITYLGTIYEPLTGKMNNNLTYTRSRANRFSNHHETILSFNVYERQCLFVLDGLDSMVYCTNDTNHNFIKEQLLKTPGAVMAVSLEIQQVAHIMVLVEDSKRSGVIVYKCGEERYITRHGAITSVRCDPKQVLHTKNPRGLSAISYQGQHFLITSAGYAENAMHHGKLHVYKYDDQNMFTLWQRIVATAPSVVAFAVLPTQELVLYALSESRTETFNVYMYRGVAGFVKQVTTSTIPKGIGLTTISMHYRHFVIVSTESNIAVIIEAKIKGEPNEL